MCFRGDFVEILYLDQEFVEAQLPERDLTAHKGDFGRVLLLCGSKGYTGAAALAAMGALRSGSGLVYLGVPESIYTIEAVKLNEPIVFPLPDCNGMFANEVIARIDAHLNIADAVLIGPGIGQGQGCMDLVQYVLSCYQGPVVLDADGINLISKHMNILRGRTSPTILTPHAGEFARLCGNFPTDRIADAIAVARDLGAIILLKGYNTVITDGETTYINTTGNPGMAVGGSGDLLSGIIVSLVGQGIVPLKAAACAAWLHGAAGDQCAAEIGQYGMLPTDMLNVLPRLMK